MGISCGKPAIKGSAFKRLQVLGAEIHAGRQPLVFDGGFVDFNPPIESEVISNGTLSQKAGPSAGSWSRQRARSRQWPAGQAESFGLVELDQAHGAEFRVLARHYDALNFEDKDGLWVAAKTNPLGPGGPQAHLLIAVPANRAITPRGWAFGKIGLQANLLPLKHTNFGDASICAFTKESGAWSSDDGLLALVDHYSLWVLKSWHRSTLGWWPGDQAGVCALYRRKEFVPRELCGCRSGRQYSDCHLFRDHAVPEEKAQREFHSFFKTHYEDRSPPAGVIRAAQTRWQTLPSIGTIYAHRICADEPAIPLV